MRIAVIGAGIVGVTTAFELARDGHQVTVFERRASVAEESSFANAGVVAPGYITPWAAPGMPAKVLRHLLSRHAPVRLALPIPPAQLGWMWRWWRACQAPVFAANRAQLYRLARYASGWALACGSARVLADQLAGRPADIDVTGLDMARLKR